MGAYDCDDGRLVGTSCSAPITCVSNNDVPKKAPYIPIDIPVASAWPKWHYCPTQVMFSLPTFSVSTCSSCGGLCVLCRSVHFHGIGRLFAHKHRVNWTCISNAMSAPLQCWAARSSPLFDQR